ncbi:MAG: alpha/beta fold hydrolase [Actinomycetes bacterium]
MTPAPRPLAITLSDGTILQGDLFLPDEDTTSSPALIMSHGFSATRAMGLPWFAWRFADAGYVVYLYDHRGLGDSSGEPRSLIDPWLQTHDMWEVVDHLRQRSEVHPDRVALWGSSFSGGEAIVLGALHPEVKAVIANVPFAGIGDLAQDPTHAEQRFIAMRVAFSNTTLDVGRQEIGPMAVVLDDGIDVAVLPQPESSQWFLANGPKNGWHNSVTIATTTTPPFDPAACSPELDGTALLMIVATNDDVASTAVALDTYARASGPKRLTMIEGHHFSAYDEPARDDAFDAMVDFLDEFL